MKEAIMSQEAPEPIGTYSQAIKVENMVFLSGQIPKNRQTNEMVVDDIELETKQVFENLSAVAVAAKGSLDQIIKLTIFLTDLNHFPLVNEVMSHYFKEPYPARSTIQVSALPANARIEIEGIMAL